jgi:hypothetical protein
MIAPHRSNRTKPPTQDRRRLRRFLRRWLVERFFAWIQWQRRILVRWEYHPENFLGFVQIACLSSSGDFEIGSNYRKKRHDALRGSVGIIQEMVGRFRIHPGTKSFRGNSHS